MVNIIEFTFLNLAVTVTLTGVLVHKFENYLPKFILQSYRYGSFAQKDSNNPLVNNVEIPKSFFRHFYIFSSFFSIASMVHMFLVYFFGFEVAPVVISFLNLLLNQQEPSVCYMSSLVVMTLFVIQCSKRFYETMFVQVFAKSSKMNITHYLAGIIHYFGCIVTVLGQAPVFSGSSDAAWIDSYTLILAMPCAFIFLAACYEQYKSNIIFANMRKDKKSQKLVTEDHGIPFGRYFELVSSPHRLSEIIMYTMVLILMPTFTMFCIYLWVVGNQVQTAIQAHEWYKKTFKNYPQDRKAIFPYIF